MNSSTCPSTDWLPHGTRCYRSVGHSLDFAACARYCAEQHEATLPCISSEEDAAVLGEEGGWLSQWALAARGDVGWASCDEVNSSSVAPWAFLEPDAGLLSLSCKHEDCTYVGPGGSGARDTSCDELQPCVCAWPAALVSIENNVAVQSTQAAELLEALPALEARVGGGAGRCSGADQKRDAYLGVCVPVLLLLSALPWRQRWRLWRRRRRVSSYEASADDDEVMDESERQRLDGVRAQMRKLQQVQAHRRRLQDQLPPGGAAAQQRREDEIARLETFAQAHPPPPPATTRHLLTHRHFIHCLLHHLLLLLQHRHHSLVSTPISLPSPPPPPPSLTSQELSEQLQDAMRDARRAGERAQQASGGGLARGFGLALILIGGAAGCKCSV